MDDFKQYLESDEVILYQGKGVVDKGNKNVFGIVFIILFALFIQIILIWSVVTGTGDGKDGVNFNFIVIFAVTLLFQGLAIYAFIYNVFLKGKKVRDEEYCLTNRRAFKYSVSRGEVVYGYLRKYDDVRCYNVKGNYGDLYMGVKVSEGDLGSMDGIRDVTEMFRNPDKCDMPSILFSSIENPWQVMKLVEESRVKLDAEV